MKKIVLFILTAAAVLLTASCGSTKTSDKNNMGSFTAEKAYSYDSTFYAEQRTEKMSDASYIVVDIYKAENSEKIFSFSPARARDFHGICWEETTYNIWIQSGDIGTFCYEYRNGIWILNENAVNPEEIVSKYD